MWFCVRRKVVARRRLRKERQQKVSLIFAENRYLLKVYAKYRYLLAATATAATAAAAATAATAATAAATAATAATAGFLDIDKTKSLVKTFAQNK